MKFDSTEKIDFYLPKVQSFIDEVVMPVEMDILKQDIPVNKRWEPHPEIEDLKKEARDRGLWILFLPDSDYGAGLTNY